MLTSNDKPDKEDFSEDLSETYGSISDLHMAVFANDYSKVSTLSKSDHTDLNCTDENNRTPLYLATALLRMHQTKKPQNKEKICALQKIQYLLQNRQSSELNADVNYYCTNLFDEVFFETLNNNNVQNNSEQNNPEQHAPTLTSPPNTIPARVSEALEQIKANILHLQSPLPNKAQDLYIEELIDAYRTIVIYRCGEAFILHNITFDSVVDKIKQLMEHEIKEIIDRETNNFLLRTLKLANLNSEAKEKIIEKLKLPEILATKYHANKTILDHNLLLHCNCVANGADPGKTTFVHQLFAIQAPPEDILYYFSRINALLGANPELAQAYLDLKDEQGLSIKDLLSKYNESMEYRGIYSVIAAQYPELFQPEARTVPADLEAVKKALITSFVYDTQKGNISYIETIYQDPKTKDQAMVLLNEFTEDLNLSSNYYLALLNNLCASLDQEFSSAVKLTIQNRLNVIPRIKKQNIF